MATSTEQYSEFIWLFRCMLKLRLPLINILFVGNSSHSRLCLYPQDTDLVLHGNESPTVLICTQRTHWI